MKKGAIILLSIIFISLTASIVNSTSPNYEEDTDATGITDAQMQEGIENFKEQTNPFVEKEIEIPEKLETITKVLFKFESPITVSQAIIATMLFIFLVLFFIDIMKSFSPFQEQTAVLMGILLALIISMIGILKSFTIFLLNLGGQSKFLENWSAGALVFIAILIVIIAVIMLKLLRVIKEHQGLAKAYERGAKAGAHHAFIEAQEKVMGGGDKI